MVCYDLSAINRANIDRDEDLPGSLIDQLGLVDFIIADPQDSVEKFCVPAFKSVPIVVGGSMIPIDTTSLLLAGASVNAWMIPVVLSAAGFAILIARKI